MIQNRPHAKVISPIHTIQSSRIIIIIPSSDCVLNGTLRNSKPYLSILNRSSFYNICYIGINMYYNFQYLFLLGVNYVKSCCIYNIYLKVTCTKKCLRIQSVIEGIRIETVQRHNLKIAR